MNRFLMPFAVAFFSIGLLAVADDFSAGRFGADTIFVAPIGAPLAQSSVRASVTFEAVDWENQVASMSFPILEAMIGVKVGTGEVELTRAKALLLRARFHQVTADFLSIYRNLDRGIDLGGDIIAVRVPIRITPNGEFIVQPGIDLGVRHYVDPIDATVFNAGVSIEARLAATLVENFMSTGIMGKVRYDLNVSEMSGFQEEAMGYLSFLLNSDRKLYLRVYVGVDDQAAREKIGLPRTNVFTGLGIQGEF